MEQKNAEMEDALFENIGKYNTSIELTPEDKADNVRVFCKEPYAQELYNKMKEYEKNTGKDLHACKDLTVGKIYEVKASQISFEDKLIFAEELNSEARIEIPFKEFSSSIDELAKGENLQFNVMIIKSDTNGGLVGSEKNCVSINLKNELFGLSESNRWFEVKIKHLIKGGYIATYKDGIDCFIPGSHAGANVIRDFSKLLGRTINVMVDNYDKSNDLFILSYKKYVQRSMPKMVSELQFGKKYTGTLTNKPYKFGVFVEFEDYYTGMIHSSEFENYDKAMKTMQAGDSVDFYVKNVTKKNGQYRIVLTLNEDDIDSEKREWDALRNRTENKIFDYHVDSNSNSIEIDIDGDPVKVTLRRHDLEKNLSLYPKVKVFKVDPINKNLKFEFVTSED